VKNSERSEPHARALCATLVAAGLLCATPALADTLIVDPHGGGDYLTIQDAIDNALSGDTIVVVPETYVEDLVVDVQVTISGAGIGQTILLPATSMPGSGNGSQVGSTTWMAKVRAHGVTITGFTLDGNNPALSPGIDARGGIVSDYTAGTWNDLEVVSCEVKNVVYRGIYAAAGGAGHRFIANQVSNVKQMPLDSVGIFFYGAVGEASQNVVDDCSIAIGFQSGGGGFFSNNVISSCDLGILANGSNSPVTISGNAISDSDQGIQSIAVNTTVAVNGNDTLRCGSGLTLFGLGSGSNAVDGNTFDGDGAAGSYGIFASTDVSPWGYGDLTFLATNNSFVSNDFGLVLYESAADPSPILSATLSSDAGSYNVFSSSVSYNLYLEVCDDDVDATYNAWGAVTPALIELTIHHQVDDPALGLVDFSNPTPLVLTVDDDGPADFTSINPAVQALLPGGTILVAPGLYVQDVVVDRSCLIQGSGTDADPSLGTVLRGSSIHPDMRVVTVTAQDVFLSGLRVDGQQPVYTRARQGIYGAGISGLTVTDCLIHTARSGIGYSSSSGGTFLRNELYGFGVSLQDGGGIFMWNSTGTVGAPGDGNYAHDGAATGFIFHNSSAGQAHDNVAANCPLGYLSNGAAAPTLFEGNQALDCDQGYQGIGNHQPVTYLRNRARGCNTGFTLFGLGAQLHTYSDNQARGGGNGFFITTECVFGDDDAVAVGRENVVSENDYGIVLDESASSVGYLMAVDLAGAGGPNWIAGSASQDIHLQGCDDDIDASSNYLGSTDPAVVEDQITHQVDDPALGLVDFSGLEPSFAYCAPKVSSQGCVPSMASSGIPSASAPEPFLLTASEIVSNQFGILFYGYAMDEQPYMGGTLCILAPFRRTPVQSSGGNPAPDCSGTFSFDFNAWIQGGNDPGLVPGVSVFAQHWYRDPYLGPPHPVGFSDALTFTIVP